MREMEKICSTPVTQTPVTPLMDNACAVAKPGETVPEAGVSCSFDSGWGILAMAARVVDTQK